MSVRRLSHDSPRRPASALLMQPGILALAAAGLARVSSIYGSTARSPAVLDVVLGAQYRLSKHRKAFAWWHPGRELFYRNQRRSRVDCAIC